MKLNEITHVWVFVDKFGDIDTEFFYPEIEENTIPYEMGKAIEDVYLFYNGEKPVRLDVQQGE